eukprot:12450080-Alexandrium_andersonii.AAC.1
MLTMWPSTADKCNPPSVSRFSTRSTALTLCCSDPARAPKAAGKGQWYSKPLNTSSVSLARRAAARSTGAATEEKGALSSSS